MTRIEKYFPLAWIKSTVRYVFTETREYIAHRLGLAEAGNAKPFTASRFTGREIRKLWRNRLAIFAKRLRFIGRWLASASEFTERAIERRRSGQMVRVGDDLEKKVRQFSYRNTRGHFS